MRPFLCIAPLALTLAIAPANAQDQASQSEPGVDYASFIVLAEELAEYRQSRLLPWDEFAAQADQPGAILLDTRSAAAFAQGHIEGAINLPFSDFTDEKLAALIPDADTPVYIYCNNNFADDAEPVPLKRTPLALNIPTFINLYGYGYRNIWELGSVVTTDQVAWVGRESAS